MKYTQKTNSVEHMEISMLLPWYVNKTLLSDENYLVENHLKSCLTCKIELTNLQKLSASISQENLLVPVAHASFLKLKNQIQKKEVATTQKTGIIDSLMSYRPKFVKLPLQQNLVSIYPSLALVSLLLFAFVFISPDFFSTKQNSANTYRTLSSSQHITQIQNSIRVVFSKDITQDKIIQILAPVQGQIVAGPTPQGVFTLRIGKEKITSKKLIDTVSFLRDNEQVIFAEPTFSLPTSNIQSPG